MIQNSTFTNLLGLDIIILLTEVGGSEFCA